MSGCGGWTKERTDEQIDDCLACCWVDWFIIMCIILVFFTFFQKAGLIYFILPSFCIRVFGLMYVEVAVRCWRRINPDVSLVSTRQNKQLCSKIMVVGRRQQDVAFREKGVTEC